MQKVFNKLYMGFGLLLPLILFQPTAFSNEVLDRDDNSREYNIAIKENGKYKYYTPTPPSIKPYNIKFPIGKITFYWAVPKYPDDKRQVVFARTSYMHNQPISLYRNSSIPWFTWAHSDRWLADRPVKLQNYIEFHKHTLESLNLVESKWEMLKLWHDTDAWSLNEKTYPFVCKIVMTDLNQIPAAERLLRLKKRREKMSWIPVSTNSPEPGQILSVTLSYSGTLDDTPSVKLYRYYFRNSR